MVKNLKPILLQHKKFLAIFFLVVFTPSLILAFFGIRAIQNERYKFEQQNLEQQKGFIKTVQADIQSLIEKNSSALKELSTSEAFLTQDYDGLNRLVAGRLQEESLFGQIGIWGLGDPPWLLGLQAHPPAVKTLAVPQEWERWQTDLGKAEEAEFKLKNFSVAVSRYTRILRRAEQSQVKAWLKNRIARCEVKQKRLQQALMTYKSIISDFPDLFTESGRPLGLVSRLEILDILRLENSREDFFRESLEIYQQLEQNVWSLDGDQLKLYAAMLRQKTDEVIEGSPSDNILESYSAAINNLSSLLDRKLDSFNLAEIVRRSSLPDIKEKVEESSLDLPQVQKNAFQYEEQDVLVLLVPLAKNASDGFEKFLGSIFRIGDMSGAVRSLVAENIPPGISVVLRSTLSGNVIFGAAGEDTEKPIITDFFSENFPPWKLELFQSKDGRTGFFLYKNIFFWTILALLVIVFFGSGLIIRTIVHEMQLLNLKSEFIASVSHEFKTPLTAMGAILERLLNDEVKDPKKTKEYYRILSHDSDKLKRLVKNVLDFTKIEDGKREYRLIEVDIGRLARQEVENFQKENQIVGFSVDVMIDDDIPPVPADEEALSQALHNILDNAAKFSGQEKNIQVRIIRRKGIVEIAVQDRGVGIPENEQKKVFEKFYRGRRASSVSPTGTGLGLTLVKHIMDAHGGDVVIKSRPGKGTCVSLILPLEKGG